MRNDILPRPEHTALLVIDVQERLLPAMQEERRDGFLKAIVTLCECAREFEIPTTFTEQYPKGLGATVAPLHGYHSATNTFEKLEFSPVRNLDFRERVLSKMPQDIVLAGMETHICVLQTATDLIKHGYRVFVPQDAVISRVAANWRNGLELMKELGASIINVETFLFERLGVAGTDQFRRLSRLIR
ncbi:MAG: isochorismatase family protein [Myxococcales bacterium]|nr:isochorismatase family protein [Myxococcales bacterium]